MTPEAAVARICYAISEMNDLYARPVFDEWALIAVTGTRASPIGYEGPRRAAFMRRLAGDLRLLRAELERSAGEPGSFGFCREGEGSLIDAFIVAGGGVFLLCNNTQVSVAEITSDPLWRKAQVPFADLAESFRLDPVALPAVAVAAEA